MNKKNHNYLFLKNKNIKELCEFIWYLEEKYDLLNLKINEIHPWAAYRMDIYYKLGKLTGVFDQSFNHKTSKLKKITYSINLIKNSFFQNNLSNLKKKDVLIFSHPISKEHKNQYIDIYSYKLIKQLIMKNKSFIDFESPFKGKHKRTKKYYTKYLDKIFLLRNIKDKFIKIQIQKNTEKKLNELNTEINKYCDFNIKEFLIHNTKKFIPTYKYYLELLKKTSPKKIYIIISYGRGELIKAAHDLNIKIIEIQHGTFSKYHLGYSFPNSFNYLYFPNKLHVWNEYWKNLISFPIKKENIKIEPFHFLEEKTKEYKNTEKIKNTLIIFGQGGVTKSIVKKIKENINYFKKFQITFKLHPNEYEHLDSYKDLIYLKEKYNISIVKNINLHKCLAKSEYQAGVFSTALYEGVLFNCKTILFDVSGIEYMNKFIEYYKPKII
ncbi:MAG: hypothetical protein CMD06_02900 [Flavobacteriales bacterium]|nr:hypothetical protein [Flavobacteriales bacterium]